MGFYFSLSNHAKLLVYCCHQWPSVLDHVFSRSAQIHRAPWHMIPKLPEALDLGSGPGRRSVWTVLNPWITSGGPCSTAPKLETRRRQTRSTTALWSVKRPQILPRESFGFESVRLEEHAPCSPWTSLYDPQNGVWQKLLFPRKVGYASPKENCTAVYRDLLPPR